MFDKQINTKGHFTGKDGEQAFDAWKDAVGIPRENFPFRVKTMKRDRRGRELNLNVVSWGYYQGSDWRYYFFISYARSDRGYTCAYHWDCGDDGFPVGQPRKHEWVN